MRQNMTNWDKIRHYETNCNNLKKNIRWNAHKEWKIFSTQDFFHKLGLVSFLVIYLFWIVKICFIMSYLVSIGHILSHLVLFCLFKSYFTLIMCYLWYLFSWSIIHRIDKVGQNCQHFRYQPPPLPTGCSKSHPYPNEY